MGLQQELDRAVAPPAPNPNEIQKKTGKKTSHEAIAAVVLLSDTWGFHLASLPAGTRTFLTPVMRDAGGRGWCQAPASEEARKPFRPLNEVLLERGKFSLLVLEQMHREPWFASKCFGKVWGQIVVWEMIYFVFPGERVRKMDRLTITSQGQKDARLTRAVISND